MINAIVASHGPLAGALLVSAEMVFGKLSHIFPVTLNDDAGIEGFKTEFARTLTEADSNADGVLVLCDMQSGTPWNIACQHAFSQNRLPPIAVIAGVNFPMLLQTDDVRHLTDVYAAAKLLLELTQPTLVIAAPNTQPQSDDF